MKYHTPVFFVFTLIAPVGLVAQKPAVSYFVNYSNRLPRISPGVRALVYGTGLGGADVAVRVGGAPAPVLSSDPWIDDNDRIVGEILTVQVPIELASGPTTLVALSNSVSSAPFDITLDRYSPVFDPRTFERTLPGGGFEAYSCLPGATPKPGEVVRAYVTGLGATDPVVANGMPAPASPLARTLVKPDMVVGGQAANVVESVLAPGEIGVYRVSFKLPAVDGIQSLGLGIGGEAVSGPTLMIGNALTLFSSATQSAQSVVETFACGGALTTVVAAGASQIVASGDGRNPPTTLAGTTVTVKDSASVERLAPLLYVSPIQVNYVVPAGTPNGNAAVTITTGDGVVSKGRLELHTIAPHLFLDAFVFGAPAGLVVRVRDGQQSVEPMILVNAAGQHQRAPIDLGSATDQVFLVLFGTGWRSRSSLAGVKMRFATAKGGFDGEVQYAGPQNEFAGLDQLNVRLPRSLAGVGPAELTLTVDDQAANFATATFK